MWLTIECPHCSCHANAVVDPGGGTVSMRHDCPARGLATMAMASCTCGLPLAGDPRRHDEACAFRLRVNVESFESARTIELKHAEPRPVF